MAGIRLQGKKRPMATWCRARWRAPIQSDVANQLLNTGITPIEIKSFPRGSVRAANKAGGAVAGAEQKEGQSR